ncbi:hypothetical protein [Solirubrum puertoriconensis]|uniref:Uncharacterized protein n=1 Tax=Solirubrum puertoriconensis TaxID=1751427 RepID=A0A9X0L652_SOLP1|nr:hypothetical protein [Solirubrum puertoriconensis]KUG09397.1 hypothetical protein ASU33_16850 [Solirubrum puertoriconensis]
MTTPQKANVDKLLTQLEQIDLTDKAKQVYTSKDIRHTMVGGDITVVEFIGITNRSIKQLRVELDKGNWQIMPYQYNDLEIGQYSLNQILQHLVSHLDGGYSFDNIQSQVLWLARYQMQLGFWDKSKHKVHSIDELKIAQANILNAATAKELESAINKANTLYKELEKAKTDLESLINDKKQEFGTILKNQIQSDTLLNEIRTHNTEASTNNAASAAFAEQQKQMLAESKAAHNADRKAFEAIRDDFNTLKSESEHWITQLQSTSTSFDNTLTNAQSKEASILGSQSRIEELLGYAADGALGHTFDQRSKALFKPTMIWAAAAVVITGLALCWVIYIFNSYKDPSGFNWSLTLLNITRTAPAFILMYFTIAQYTKERNLQEEYAFKSAVARTVTAYSAMIHDADHKTSMLINTIQGIYSPPSIGKQANITPVSSQHLVDATKSVAETATALKTTATELISAVKK